jgi:hypothetical protein
MSICLFCEKKIPLEKKHNKFCNSSCSASFNNKGIRRNISLGTRPVNQCLFCGSDTLNPKYCSTECSVDHKISINQEEIKKTGKINSNKTGKNFLIKERGHKCEICGNKEWLNNPILLILDHIDGNSDNNQLTNVRLLCSNCDATLPTYKSRNKNNGRDSRRQIYRKNRYKNGSCN